MTTTTLLEVEEIFRRHAWNILKSRSNFIRRALLDEEDFVVEVDWSYLSIDHKVAKFSPKEQEGTLIETNWGKVMTGSRWVSLWSCDFDNKSDGKQSHTFRGSRDTTTWVDVDLDQGYTVDKEVCVSVNVPPNFSKFRAGRDNSFSVNKVKGQVFKEVLTWEVNSQVEVLPSWKAHAQLLAKEECQVMGFEIRSTIFNPKGIVPVKFLRKSDRRTAYVVEVDNFQEAFKLEEEGGVLKPEEKPCVEIMMEKSVDMNGEESSASYTQLITRGSCVCVSWSDQKVDIKTCPLSVDESTLDGDGNLTVVNNVSGKQFTIKAN